LVFESKFLVSLVLIGVCKYVISWAYEHERE
jgi:hypothetical protein